MFIICSVSILIMFFLDALREMQKYSSDEIKDVSTREICCPPSVPPPSILKGKGGMYLLDMWASRINTVLFLSVQFSILSFNWFFCRNIHKILFRDRRIAIWMRKCRRICVSSAHNGTSTSLDLLCSFALLLKPWLV